MPCGFVYVAIDKAFLRELLTSSLYDVNYSHLRGFRIGVRVGVCSLWELA